MTLQMLDVVARPGAAEGNPRIRRLVALLANLALICSFATVSAYNIDTSYPIIYPNDATNAQRYLTTNFARGYFGYSVLLHRDSQRNSSWLFVGAPRGNYTTHSRFRRVNEPGVVYRCAVPGPCLEIEPAILEDEYARVVGASSRIMKERSWFGGAMSIDRSSGYLTICAPRTIVSIPTSLSQMYTMHGICYNNPMFWDSTVHTDTSYIDLYDFSKTLWNNPLHGFSVTYAPSHNHSAIFRIVGEPNHDLSGSITMVGFERSNLHKIYRRTRNVPRYDDVSRLGYSTTAGYYFNQSELFFAVGDPTWNLMGQVAVLRPGDNSLMIVYITGNDIGEYFGGSLATGDLNQDGLDDLVVGAPHWKNDNGRVHIFLGTDVQTVSLPKRQFHASATLEGAVEDALFGYAVACGDLDRDGFSDIIVGAPWEESGVIYIYNGDTSLKDKVRPIASQRITMQSPAYNLPRKLDIQGFGFSIAEPIDIDNNGYVDIAVGAYKTGHAVILRTKPVVRTSLTINTVPDTLPRDINNFLVKVCVQYNGYYLTRARRESFKILLTVDENYKRTENTSLELTNAPDSQCVETKVTLVKDIRDFIEPIAVYAVHEFAHESSPARNFCKTCPISESKSDASRGAQVLLPFDIGCGLDRVCNSNISAIVRFSGVRNNNSWVIGSNDITLEATLTNHAELSYLTTIAFTLPRDIVLRSISRTCEEDTVGDNLTITCNAGNPLGTNEQKTVKLNLDMRRVTDGSLHGQVLEFSMKIGTRSVNRGTSKIKSSLTLLSEAFLTLNGKANGEIYYLPALSKEQLNVSFGHTYQIVKSGATPITEARLLVNIPTSINGSNPLIFLYKPRIYVAGEYLDCLSYGVEPIDEQQNELHNEITLHAFNTNVPLFNSTPQNVQRELRKRDISSHINLASRIMKELSADNIRSENSTGNFTWRDIMHINCSTNGVNCSTVSCDLSALKTQWDIGKLAVRLILNVTKLRDTVGLSDETKVVKFSTEARVKILQPANRIINENNTRRSMDLTTEFRSSPKSQELKLWVLLLSVSLGLIILCIFILVLYVMGFFKRAAKEDLMALKETEVTNDVNKGEATDASD